MDRLKCGQSDCVEKEDKVHGIEILVGAASGHFGKRENEVRVHEVGLDGLVRSD